MNGSIGGTAWSIGKIVAALLIAAGIAGGGWLIGRGLLEARSSDRFVSVKGLAERDVKADLALWPLRFVATGNDLQVAKAKIAADEAAIRKFVTGAGVPDSAIEVVGFEVTDLLAQVYRSGPVESRFVLAATLIVRSNDVDRIAALAQKVGDLVDAGVVLSTEGAPSGPVFLFTALNDAKPEMVAEATRNAREAAQEFARDSGSQLGGIRRASQGVFQILSRDEAPGIQEPYQVNKRLRVVSTVDYYLTD
ncbi:MAG: SIMPL domain-containing protein [Geminicoccaceae bacterium]